VIRLDPECIDTAEDYGPLLVELGLDMLLVVIEERDPRIVELVHGGRRFRAELETTDYIDERFFCLASTALAAAGDATRVYRLDEPGDELVVAALAAPRPDATLYEPVATVDRGDYHELAKYVRPLDDDGLVARHATRVGSSIDAARVTIGAWLAAITTAIGANGRHKIPGFGAFSLQPRRLVFTPSQVLKHWIAELRGGDGASDPVVGTIVDALCSDHDAVRLRGLGTIYRAKLRAYTGRNPRTGVVVMVHARTLVLFEAD
jgi:nucleoid DNA-binding protein